MGLKALPTPTEVTAMRVLQQEPAGMYGLQLVENSDGEISRGAVYVLLGRMTVKGLVTMTKPKAEPGYPGLPRPIYRLSPEGVKVLKFVDQMDIGGQGVMA